MVSHGLYRSDTMPSSPPAGALTGDQRASLKQFARQLRELLDLLEHGDTEFEPRQLQERQINIRVFILISDQCAVLHIADDADDLIPDRFAVLVITDGDALAYGVFVRPITPRHGFADDHHRRGLPVILRREVAPFDERDAERRKEVRRYSVVIHTDFVFSGARRAAHPARPSDEEEEAPRNLRRVSAVIQ